MGMPQVVPRHEVWHLGPLGTAVPGRIRRLVCPQHVLPRRMAKPLPRRALRRPRTIRREGTHPRLEGRGVEPRRAGAPLQRSRSPVLHDAGTAPRQLRPVGLALPGMELGESRAQARHRGRMGQGMQEVQTAAGHIHARQPCLDVVRGCTSLRRQPDESRRQRTVVGRIRPTGTLRPAPHPQHGMAKYSFHPQPMGMEEWCVHALASLHAEVPEPRPAVHQQV